MSIKIGIIGAGGRAQHLMKSLVKMPGAKIVGICDVWDANLEKASFVGARGYSIDPRSNKIRKAAFSVPDVLSLLEAFEIVIKDE